VISMTWTDAPTGFSGSGGVAVRPAACLAAAGNRIVIAPVAVQVQGTGVPVAVRLRAIDERHTARPSYLKDITGLAPVSTNTENNGTTLGVHPPGRPQS
jgi:hypothetical protein